MWTKRAEKENYYITPNYCRLGDAYSNKDVSTWEKTDYITMQTTDLAGCPAFKSRRRAEIQSARKVRQSNPVYYHPEFRDRYPQINGKNR